MVDILRLRKLTTLFVAVGCIVGDFRIDQGTAHVDEGLDSDRDDIKIMLTV